MFGGHGRKIALLHPTENPLHEALDAVVHAGGIDLSASGDLHRNELLPVLPIAAYPAKIPPRVDLPSALRLVENPKSLRVIDREQHGQVEPAVRRVDVFRIGRSKPDATGHPRHEQHRHIALGPLGGDESRRGKVGMHQSLERGRFAHYGLGRLPSPRGVNPDWLNGCIKFTTTSLCI